VPSKHGVAGSSPAGRANLFNDLAANFSSKRRQKMSFGNASGNKGGADPSSEESTGESEVIRKLRLEALFESLGEPAVQMQVLNPACTPLFPGRSKAYPTREEANDWLSRKAHQRGWKVWRDRILFWSAIIAAISATAGPFL